MRLFYNVTTKDGNTQSHECIDFASFGSDFITFYKKDFVRDMIRTESVMEVKQYFKR